MENEILKKLLPFVIALVALLVGGAIGAAITWNVTSSNPTYVEDQEMTLGLKSGKKTGTYTGEVKDGTPNGTGTFTCKAKDDSGFTYSGQWKNGHINGYGFMEKQTGEKYVGSYKDDYVSDYGVLTMATGDVYCGQMDKSVTMKGKGILCLDGDSYFSGIFSDLYYGVGTQCDDNTLKTGTMTDRTTFVSDEEQKKRDEQEAAEKKKKEETEQKKKEDKQPSHSDKTTDDAGLSNAEKLQIFQEYNDLLNDENSPAYDLENYDIEKERAYESKVKKQVAKKYDITEEQLQQIYAEGITGKLTDFDVNSISLPNGTLKDATVNGNALVVKAKTTFSWSNQDVIDQNYDNVGWLITKDGADTFSEIQYWAVADMNDGSEQKIISFTLNESIIAKIKSGAMAFSDIGKYADDLYIHPSLRS